MALIVALFQIWTGDFFGLWQMQNWNFGREKAFNLAMSKHSTRCCVCSLFDNPSVFNQFKPDLVSKIYQELNSGSSEQPSSVQKPITELRVVVQRVLINLPSTSAEARNEQNCCIDGDELVTCNSCGICVHRCA